MKNKNSNHQKLVSAKELAENAGLSYGVINYYTDLGILEVVERKSKTRMYDLKNAQKRLFTVSRLRIEGYPLRMITKIIK